MLRYSYVYLLQCLLTLLRRRRKKQAHCVAAAKMLSDGMALDYYVHPVEWPPHRATAAQRAMIETALADVAAVLPARFPKSADRGIVITMRRDEAGYTEGTTDDDLLGWWDPEDRLIFLQPHLTGRRLYHVMVHEIGHVLGLPHAATGIMAVSGQPKAGPLTLHTRRAAMRDISRAWITQRVV